MHAQVGGVRKKPIVESIQRNKEKIMRMLRRKQKRQLDTKIDELLKDVRKTRKIIITFFQGAGSSVGRGIEGAFRGVGKSISSLLGRR